MRKENSVVYCVNSAGVRDLHIFGFTDCISTLLFILFNKNLYFIKSHFMGTILQPVRAGSYTAGFVHAKVSTSTV